MCHESLASFSAGAYDAAFAGRVLVPWPNRVRDGRYAIDGVEHRLEISEPERGNALHGLVLQSRWRGVPTSPRRVSLSYALAPRPGYPFELALAVSYELASGGIVMTLHATNVGAKRAPFGAGLHPYLTPGATDVDDMVLEIPARSHVPGRRPAAALRPGRAGRRDRPRLPPTAAPGPAACGHVLRRARLQPGRRRPRARLGTNSGPGQLTVWMDERFRFVQVFTADAAIAVEPMTRAPDAFNTGDGLVVLEPGASFTGRCGLIAAGL